MTWLIGIDEAGYGPNLGPFVMTAVACRVPKALAEADLWKALHRIVRRDGEKKRLESRLLIADSKVVYSPNRGLKALELGVLATLLHEDGEPPPTLGCLLTRFAGRAHTELSAESWFTGTTPLPLVVSNGAAQDFASRFMKASRANDISWSDVNICAVCPARFNQIIAQSGTKGEVSAHALQSILPPLCHLLPVEDSVRVLIDKHGGRNHYADILQQAFPAGMVMIQAEGPERSQYEVYGLGRQVRLTFQPRADSAHFCVSLASMISKYLRELLMHEFNAFWQTHVPGLKATAGYPLDATRFWQEIAPAAQQLGLPEESVWRRR
jgi:ribonuclease HII